MRTMNFGTLASRTAEARSVVLDRSEIIPRAALGLIVALAAGLRLADLAALGYANSYYAAGVKSMLQSWHNFFFVAAEPGGSVSLDKPPVGFWLQAISAHLFGVNSLGLLLPQILAGVFSVIVVYHLVRRSFGTVAGLLAGLALAITPVAVATDRNNTIDSTLILTLLLAAWAFIVATERGKLRYLLLGTALVGVGFNIKMLEAYLPLPAFYALYFLGSSESLRRKLGNLTLASVVLVVVSLSWVVAVDLTPADQRPYVGSSTDNSEMSLAIGYNGVERLLGMGGRGGLLSQFLGGTQSGGPRGDAQDGGFRDGGQQGQVPDSAFRPPAPGGNGSLPTDPHANSGFPFFGFGSSGAFQQAGPGGFPGGGGGMFNTGQPGALRLFTQPLSKEVSWLLPFGLFSIVLLAFRTRPRWPLAPKHQALVLWGGWLLTGAVFFSVAGFFHQYYLSMLGAPLAALVGIGAMELWKTRGRHPWVATALLVVAGAGTLAFQIATARAFTSGVWWVPLTVAALALGAGLLVAASARTQWQRAAMAGFGFVVAAMLITPGIWSGLTALDPGTSSNLPAAYSGQGFGRGGQGPGPGSGDTNVDQSLLSYLESHTQGVKYLVAVPASQEGSGLVLATGRPVLYMGGFSGQDPVVTTADLDRMVADGELKYILWSGNGRGGPGGQSDIASWLAANGKPVQDLNTQTGNADSQGASVAGARSGGTPFGGPGFMRGTLYEVGTGTKS